MTEHVRLVRELGHGAMGAVWVADHLTLDTHVAVKFINKHLLRGDGDELRVRFSREAKAAAQIKSPHVVQIFDHGIMEDDTPYIVMELLEGESLADRLERTGWLSLKQCVQVVAQTAAALAKAHKLGIVHRDIKPENVFLCPSDDGLFVKLLDFGIAKHDGVPQRGMTVPGMVIGTAEYMSREQVVSAADVDHHADLWGLAVVAYEVLTGDVPFTGDTVGGIWASIVRGRYLPPSSLRKECPENADDFFKRAFAFEKGDRFPSARELASAYRDALEVSMRVSTSFDLRPAPATRVGLGGKEAIADELPEAPPLRIPVHRKRPWLAIAGAAALGSLFAAWLAGRSDPLILQSHVEAPRLPEAEPPARPTISAPPAPPEPAAPAPRPVAPPPPPSQPETQDHVEQDPARTDYGF